MLQGGNSKIARQAPSGALSQGILDSTSLGEAVRTLSSQQSVQRAGSVLNMGGH
jgi:hypothetical protein